jgi:hypothetical protein
MSELNDLVIEVMNEVKKIADNGCSGTLSMAEYQQTMARIRDKCHKIFQRGHTSGWNNHAATIRARLLRMADNLSDVDEP